MQNEHVSLFIKILLKFQDMLQQGILGTGPSVTAQVNLPMTMTRSAIILLFTRV